MSTKTRLREKEKRKRGRPAKNKIEPIEATPEEIGRRLQERQNTERRSDA